MSHEAASDTPPSSPWTGRERLAGLCLVAFGLFTFWAGRDLPFFTSDGVGSGLMPRSLSVLVTITGIIQLVVTWREPGPSTGRWPIRDMLPVLIGVFLFAITIRGYNFGAFRLPPLGLVVATPLAIIASGLAAKDARWKELLIFAVIMTVVCTGLFRFALGLSIPAAPWLIGY